MTAPLFPNIPGNGLARGNSAVQTRDQLEQSTPMGSGFSRTTRGTFYRRRLRLRRLTFPGYGYLGADRYYDDAIVPDTAEDHLGYEIVDNSSGAKTWLKVDLTIEGAGAVTYETNGPGVHPHNPNEVWFKIADYPIPFYVPRTG